MCLVVFGISLESCSHCELVSCKTLSAVGGATTVIISDLLSACVTNLCAFGDATTVIISDLLSACVTNLCAFGGATTVIISDLLSSCVTNLCNCCFSCYL
ncbi:hypothetical protein AVEN_241189-1 [Araneus ventricosus]|uniref:Uncharacterized protein n=1 Tax=Araneus ventricosus TaxID=182803 RepID=A0A4Y2G2S7_ARAVE|nr:hypothetical protein AVEN_241189-1 [Araneus ventricosus]